MHPKELTKLLKKFEGSEEEALISRLPLRSMKQAKYMPVYVNELHGDYYVFREERMELRGEMSGKTFKIGQKMRTMVTGTDRLTMIIDFIPAKNNFTNFVEVRPILSKLLLWGGAVKMKIIEDSGRYAYEEKNKTVYSSSFDSDHVSSGDNGLWKCI